MSLTLSDAVFKTINESEQFRSFPHNIDIRYGKCLHQNHSIQDVGVFVERNSFITKFHNRNPIKVGQNYDGRIVQIKRMRIQRRFLYDNTTQCKMLPEYGENFHCCFHFSRCFVSRQFQLEIFFKSVQHSPPIKTLLVLMKRIPKQYTLEIMLTRGCFLYV